MEESGHAVLVVENGFPNRLRFNAAIARTGDFQHTDVCEVIGGRSGMEHGLYAIAEISLDRMRLLPETGQHVACDDAPDALPPIFR